MNWSEFLCLALLASSTSAFNCSISPIYSDFHKRAVAGSSVFQWGSFIGVGTPALHQSIWPSLRRNETSFASSDFCNHSNLTDCIDSTGGNIQYNSSSTWHESANYSSADNEPIGSSITGGTDVLHIFTHYFEYNPPTLTDINDFPVEFVNQGDTNPGVVGLGSSSTVIQQLYSNGLIAARTYGFYFGTATDRAAGVINGSLTFGGYDSGRFLKPVHTYDMDLSNEDFLPVTVSDIIVDDPSNPGIHNVSLMGDEKPFEARITSDQYPMKLPVGITRRFMSTLSAGPSDSPDGSLQLSKPFNGTMKIVLSDGFNVTLPSETVYNISGLSPVAANNDTEDSGPFYLSAAWLGQVYMTLDYESSKFHLAQAIQKNAYVMPVTLCPGSTPVPFDYSKKASAFLRKGLIGAVVGGVIGGVALFTLIVALFVSWKRGQSRKDDERRWALQEKAWGKIRLDSTDMEMSPLREKRYGPTLIPPAAHGTMSHVARPTYAPVPVPTPYSYVNEPPTERSSSPVSSLLSFDGAEGDSGSRRVSRTSSTLSIHLRA